MADYVGLFIKELRAGKTHREAFQTYCWARSVVPIDRVELRQKGDPFECRRLFESPMAALDAADAFDDGVDDEAIAAAWARGAEWDREFGPVYRPMTKQERPTQGQLLEAMTPEEREKAGELLGVPAWKLFLAAHQ